MRERILVAVLVGFIGSGCAALSNHPPLRSCERSGEARASGIPLASRGEHLQAQRFEPSDPGSCLVYVVRVQDWWSSTRTSQAVVGLANFDPAAVAAPSLAAFSSPADSRVATVRSDMYAMWELPSGSYLVYAVFVRDYGRVNLMASLLDPGRADGALARYVPRVRVDCQPGDVTFLSVRDRGFFHRAVLMPVDRERVERDVRDGLRSVGRFQGEPLYRECPAAR